VGAHAWALFLDFDGTLVELAWHPDAVVVDDSLRQLMDRLLQRLDGAVAVVTGREIRVIDRLFSHDRFVVAGLHGLESRLLDPFPELRDQAETTLRELGRELEGKITSYPGVMVERKGASLALHYRNAPQADAWVRSVAYAALTRLGSLYRLVEGKDVIELLPAVASKGAAIVRLMSQPPFAGRRPVFIGDDVSDESGFAAVNEMDGVSIHVGDAGPTLAKWRLPDVGAVRDWLLHDLCPEPPAT